MTKKKKKIDVNKQPDKQFRVVHIQSSKRPSEVRNIITCNGVNEVLPKAVFAGDRKFGEARSIFINAVDPTPT